VASHVLLLRSARPHQPVRHLQGPPRRRSRRMDLAHDAPSRLSLPCVHPSIPVMSTRNTHRSSQSAWPGDD
jgi:hypothetical protein